MSQHQGYGGRAGSGGHGVPVPVEPLHRKGRDAWSQWEKAQAHRARFGPDAPAPKTSDQFSLTAAKRRRPVTPDDGCPEVVA